MRITKAMLVAKLQYIAKENAPVRVVYDAEGNVKTKSLKTGKLYTKSGRAASRAVGKPGTNMYSPYPGNLKNNGVVRIDGHSCPWAPTRARDCTASCLNTLLLDDFFDN